MKFMERVHADGANRLFWVVFVATALIKLATAFVLPITEDEAYFVIWGRHPALGYYDHGGITGWWMAALLQLGDATTWLRLPTIAVSLFVGMLVRHVLRPVDRQLANLAGTIWLLSPANLFNSFVTTDTPLLLCSVLAVVAALRADRTSGATATVWWLFSGVCLGAAFLSKYLAVLTGAALVLWLLFGGSRPRIGALALLLLGAVPGIAINVGWNHAHGWTNVLFNVATRNANAGLTAIHPLFYLLSWAIVIGPLVFVATRATAPGMRRRIAGAFARWRETGMTGVAFAAIVPAVVLGAVSLFQSIGLHWLLSFAPWAIVAIALVVPREATARLILPSLVFAGAQLVILAVIMVQPISLARSHRSYASVVLAVKPGDVVARIEPWMEGYTLATDSYGKASLLSYHTGQHVPVFGLGSHHGRHDDLITDFRRYDGANVMIVTNRERRVAMMPPWFVQAEIREIDVHGARLFVLLGRGFRYDVYRESVLRPVAERYYAMPAWLLQLSGPGDLVRRYELQNR